MSLQPSLPREAPRTIRPGSTRREKRGTQMRAHAHEECHMSGDSTRVALLRQQGHNLLAQHALTKGCSPDARNALYRAAEWRSAGRDQVLAQEGDPVASLVVVCKGTLRLHRKASGTR